MEKKIAALKSAYARRDAVAIRNAARALVSHDHKHPFAAMCAGTDAADIVRLARRICDAPSIPLPR